MTHRLLTAVIVFVSVIAVQWPSGAETIDRFRATLHGVQVGDPVPDPRCPAGMVLVSLTGDGSAVHIGPVDVAASHCIVDDPSVEPFTLGEMTLSTSDGTIDIEYEGNDAGGDLSGTWTVTGGTGRSRGERRWHVHWTRTGRRRARPDSPRRQSVVAVDLRLATDHCSLLTAPST